MNDLLLEYTDGTLSEDLRTRVDAHLAGCASCVAFLDSYRAIPKLFRDHTELEMPEEMRVELRRILAERKQRL